MQGKSENEKTRERERARVGCVVSLIHAVDILSQAPVLDLWAITVTTMVAMDVASSEKVSKMCKFRYENLRTEHSDGIVYVSAQQVCWEGKKDGKQTSWHGDFRSLPYHRLRIVLRTSDTDKLETVVLRRECDIGWYGYDENMRTVKLTWLKNFKLCRYSNRFGVSYRYEETDEYDYSEFAIHSSNRRWGYNSRRHCRSIVCGDDLPSWWPDDIDMLSEWCATDFRQPLT